MNHKIICTIFDGSHGSVEFENHYNDLQDKYFSFASLKFILENLM